MAIRRRGTIVFLLTGLNLLNFLDRWLISAVSPAIKRELALSDLETGIVLNAFLVGFMVTSPIFGRLGDRWPRKWLIAAGVAVWCGATAGSGLVSTFASLVAVRLIVGLGEASYASLAPTILDDITPLATKGRTFAIFFAAIPIGSALGFIVGGQLEAHYGWRNAFFIAGGPGLLLVIACAMMVEPARPRTHAAQVPLGRAIREILSSRRYVWVVIGAIPQTAVLGCFGSWAPHYLERRFNLPTAEADTKFGIIIVVTGFVGSFVGGWWTDKVKDVDRLRASMKVCATAACVAAPLCMLCLVGTTPTMFFVFSFLAQLAIWASFAPYNTVVLGAVPSEARGTAMAISIFAGHAFGDLPAIPLVGLLSDELGSLPDAMLALPALMVVCAAAWIVGARVKSPTPAISAPSSA